MHRLVRTAAATAAGALVASAHAGLIGTGASIDLMQVGAGYIDIQTFGSELVDSATIATPPLGSRIFLGGLIPGTESFYSDLEFSSAGGNVASFSFENEIDVTPFALPEYEWAFAGNRLSFTSDVAVDILLDAELFLEGGGIGFFEIYGDDQAPVLFVVPTERLGYFFTLGPGTHTIAWGVMSSPTGGSGSMNGSLNMFFVPAPGVAALLGLAGIAGLGASRRRRA